MLNTILTYAVHRRKPLSVQYVRFYRLTDGKQGYRYYVLLVFYVGKWRRAPLKYNQTRRADGIIHVCMLKKIVSSKTVKRKHPIQPNNEQYSFIILNNPTPPPPILQFTKN